MHEMMLEIVKQQYKMGCNIDNFVSLGTITPAEYKEITGQDYGVEETKYYLPLLDGLYISLDADKKIHLINKGFESYQQMFTQTEINGLQENKEIKNKINLENCKVTE